MALLESWGVQIDNDLLEVTGRVIPGPMLKLNATTFLDFGDSETSAQNQREFNQKKTPCYLPV
jgi:hypothetical protein